ncbi:MAG TPA: hypothetical protein VFL62_09575 [Bradyrhizobium sp.]|uniref:hypothetical protein n=1 Tax=Bradyrhizobium sp. TaxID=376 RepID=UPI002D7F75FC|nr:hypothetical protein [Bradyrhizobium sp.]HET7886461.1 hypothetical protein [Bradyrhizobium sp.]
MADTSSVSSSTTTFLNRPAGNLNQAKAAAGSTFANILNQTEVAIGLRPKTGFSSGATYEATTIAGQTKATYNSIVDATKAALHIK